VTLTWLRNLLTGIVLLAGMAVVLYLLELGENPSVVGLNPANVYDDYNLLGVAVFVYAIGFIGLRQPEIFDSRWHAIVSPDTNAGVAAEASDAAKTGAAPTGDVAHKPRYARSGIDANRARSLKIRLIEIMDSEKLYRKQDLTLQDLADATGASTHNLTEVLNTQLGKKFYDFVNDYRVKEVAERLADPASAHLTLLSLGEDAGFNSKSSFNAVFKKHMRMTPSQYRDSFSSPSD
jgi:AraC-like DNA-binding protein